MVVTYPSDFFNNTLQKLNRFYTALGRVVNFPFHVFFLTLSLPGKSFYNEYIYIKNAVTRSFEMREWWIERKLFRVGLPRYPDCRNRLLVTLVTYYPSSIYFSPFSPHGQTFFALWYMWSSVFRISCRGNLSPAYELIKMDDSRRLPHS